MMSDTAHQLRQDLSLAIAADAAATRTGSPDALRLRGHRRRRARGVLAATGALALAAGAAIAVGLPPGDDTVTGTFATGGASAPVVLDRGTALDGPWTLIVTEQHCIERKRRYGQEGACSLTEPGRLQDASSFRTEDQGQAVTVVNGPLPNGTARVTIDFEGAPSVQASPVAVDGRLFFAARVPAEAAVSGLVARDDSGQVLARRRGLPPPSS